MLRPSTATAACAAPSATTYRRCSTGFRCQHYHLPFCTKGFQGCRVAAHWLGTGTTVPGPFLQSSTLTFGVDIHPAARFGQASCWTTPPDWWWGKPQWWAIMSPYCVRDPGGTGKQDGDRHPKIGDGVLTRRGKNPGHIQGRRYKVGAGSEKSRTCRPIRPWQGCPPRSLASRTQRARRWIWITVFLTRGRDTGPRGRSPHPPWRTRGRD